MPSQNNLWYVVNEVLCRKYSDPSQSEARKDLSSEDAAILEKYRSYPVTYIQAQDFPRVLYFLQCAEVRFRDEQDRHIYKTEGSGEIIIPPHIKVMIKIGKSRVKDSE